jgi:hypothetical protein
MEGQAMLPVKALMRKTASRFLLLMWSESKYNLSKMFSYIKVPALLKNLVYHGAANFL